MSQIVLGLFLDMGVSPDSIGTVDGPLTVFKAFVPIVLVSLIVFPLSLMREMSKVRYIALGSVISLAITLAVVIFETPFYVRDYIPTLSE